MAFDADVQATAASLPCEAAALEVVIPANELPVLNSPVEVGPVGSAW